MYSTYVLQSISTGRYYIGYTNNLPRRMIEHNSNNTPSLRNKGPYKLIYHESYEEKHLAIARERQIKAYKGGRAFKDLIMNSVA